MIDYLCQLFWAYVLLVRARNRLRNAKDAIAYHAEAMENESTHLDYWVNEESGRQVDLSVAEVEFTRITGGSSGTPN